MESKWKNKNFKSALNNSMNGIYYIYKNERNFKLQLVFAFIAIVLALLLKLSFNQIALIIIVIFLVLLTEFLNTALEVIVDMYTEEYNEKAKIAKDISAGAVTLMAICSIIIGIIIYLPAMLNFVKILINNIKR